MYKYFMDLFNKIKQYRYIFYFSDGTYLIREDRDMIIYFESNRNARIYVEMWMDDSRAVDDDFIWNNGMKFSEDEKEQLIEKIKLYFPKYKIVSLHKG